MVATNKGASRIKNRMRKPLERTPWNGNLEEKELRMPGGVLLAALVACANQRRQQMNQMATELGVTYGYINQLRQGLRKTSQVSEDFIQACAQYLNLPRLSILMMAGKIGPEDYFVSPDIAKTAVSRAFEFVCSDPTWGALVPAEVRTGSLESQYMTVRFYEKATGTKLMAEQLDLSEFEKQLASVKKTRFLE